MSSEKKPVIGFAEMDEAVIVRKTVIHLSPEAFDFIDRHTDRSGHYITSWEAKNVEFGILSSGMNYTQFFNSGNTLHGLPRLYMNADHFRGKRVVLEEVLNISSDEFTDKHRADLKVALKELADAVRAEATVTGFALDLQAF
jgi:hypothetical protein